HEYQTKMLSNYFGGMRLSPDIHKMFLSSRKLRWESTKDIDENEIFEDLPKDLLQQAKNHMFLDLVKTVPLFVGLDETFYNMITLKMKNIMFPPGCFIFRKGDKGNELFIVKGGEVEIMNADGLILVTLKGGSSFGEIALYQENGFCKGQRSRGAVHSIKGYVSFHDVLL
ncbi:Cyclic nucleotide-gated olfactory channel, partial [Dinochytrium kinnereticum]